MFWLASCAPNIFPAADSLPIPAMTASIAQNPQTSSPRQLVPSFRMAHQRNTPRQSAHPRSFPPPYPPEFRLPETHEKFQYAKYRERILPRAPALPVAARPIRRHKRTSEIGPSHRETIASFPLFSAQTYKSSVICLSQFFRMFDPGML